MDSSAVEAITEACKKGDVIKLDGLLEGYCDGVVTSRAINTIKIDASKHTLLHEAALNNRVQLMNYLLNHGADTEAIDKNENTPLHYAAKDSCVDAITLLAQSNSNFNVKDVHDVTPLLKCLHNNQLQAAEIMLLCKADIHFKVTSRQCPALHVMCKAGNIGSTRFLIDRGASLLRKDREAESVLHQSVGNVELTKLICDHAVKQKVLHKLLKMTSNTGENVFHYFANEAKSKSAAMAILIAATVPISYTTLVDVLNEQDRRPAANTPLHTAVKKNRMDVLECLLKYHEFIRFDVKNAEGESALNIAVKEDNYEMFDLLLTWDTEGSSLYTLDNQGNNIESLVVGKPSFSNRLSLAFGSRSRRLCSNVVKALIPTHKYTCVIMIDELPLCNANVCEDLCTFTDLCYSYDIAVVGVTCKNQPAISLLKKNNLKMRILSDETQSVYQRYSLSKKSKAVLSNLIRRNEVVDSVASLLLIDAHEIVICKISELNKDAIKVLSFYVKSLQADSQIRIRSMEPRHDLFDWILQNEVICKDFAKVLSSGMENNSFMFGNIQQVIKGITNLDKKKTNAGEDLGMIHLYQKYVLKNSPLGPSLVSVLSASPTQINMDSRQMRKESRSEALLLYMEHKTKEYENAAKSCHKTGSSTQKIDVK
ncbi:hypothetical protein AKO1_011989 [Acrasis kona]|uniref:Uncharacterized protein n=1 Tax=Acrasis kona TaxID=1008807 RepID=A0AAW2ZAU7_9EUKA